jgi:hypothetical protein
MLYLRKGRWCKLGSSLEKQSPWSHYHGTISWWNSFWTLWWKLVAPYFSSFSSQTIHDSRRNLSCRTKWRYYWGAGPFRNDWMYSPCSYLIHRDRCWEWWWCWEWGGQEWWESWRWLWRYWSLLSPHKNTFQKGGKDIEHYPRETHGKRGLNQRKTEFIVAGALNDWETSRAPPLPFKLWQPSKYEQSAQWLVP